MWLRWEALEIYEYCALLKQWITIWTCCTFFSCFEAIAIFSMYYVSFDSTYYVYFENVVAPILSSLIRYYMDESQALYWICRCNSQILCAYQVPFTTLGQKWVTKPFLNSLVDLSDREISFGPYFLTHISPPDIWGCLLQLFAGLWTPTSGRGDSYFRECINSYEPQTLKGCMLHPYVHYFSK